MIGDMYCSASRDYGPFQPLQSLRKGSIPCESDFAIYLLYSSKPYSS